MRHSLIASLLALAISVPALISAADDKTLKPTNLKVNTSSDEDEPHVGDAGLTLYFGVREKGKEQVRVASRQTGNLSWPTKTEEMDDYVANKGVIRGVYATQGRYPLFLYFAAKDNTKGKNYDLFVAIKHGPDKVWSAPTPVMNVNTEEDEAHPWMTFDGKSLYFSRKTKDGWQVFVSTRPSVTGPGGWKEPKAVDLPAGYHHATLTRDGKTMYLQGPLEKDRWGLFASRANGKGWSKPEALEALNDTEGKTGDRSPNLSRDGRWLYFSSDRPGGKGGLDLWAIDASKLTKKK
jgi:WD40-like Beta Propeller Repeat